MRNALTHIALIATNERRMLYRMAKFWLLALGGLGATCLILFVSTLATVIGRNPPAAFMLESTDAYLSIFFFSFAQAVLIVFIAADFRKAEENARLDQVMLSRPIGTGSWVFGKYFGVVSAMVYLNLFLLLLAAIGRTIKVLNTGVGFHLLPFFQYFFLITLPAILFITAFVFLLSSLFRAQSIAIIIALAYIAAIWAYFRFKFYGLFDYGGFFAPLFASDLIGIGQLGPILRQRAMYLCLTVSFICLTILLYPRLEPPSNRRLRLGLLALLGVCGASIIGYSIVHEEQQQKTLRERARLAARHAARQPTCRVSHYDLQIALNDSRQPLRVVAKMAVANPNPAPLRRLVLALNDGMQVNEVRLSDGSAAAFEHELHLLRIDLNRHPLLPGAQDTLLVTYSGTIAPDGGGFLFDRIPDMHGMRYRDDGPWFMGEISAMVTPEFVLLPAEVGWFPRPAMAGDRSFGDRQPQNFVTAEITVTAPSALTVISQGVVIDSLVQAGRRTVRFKVEQPVPKLSLHAGRYQRLARTFQLPGEASTLGISNRHDSTQTLLLELYYREHHIRNLQVFSEIADTCYQAITRILEIIQEETGLPYPYPKLAYVEVPLQHQIYPGRQGFPRTAQQPQIVLIDELRLAGHNFQREIDHETRQARRRRQDDSPARIKRDVFLRAALALITDREIDNSLLSPIPNYLNYQVDIRDPVLDRALELMLFENVERRLREVFFPDRWRIPRSRLEEIRSGDGWWSRWRFEQLYQVPFDTMITHLETTALSALTPERNKGLYFGAVDYKASPVLQILAATIGRDAFHQGLRELLRSRRFAPVGREDFLSIMQTQTASDLSNFFRTWFDKATFPGYRITQATAEKIDTGKMKIMYQVTTRVQNGEAGAGFVQVVFHSKNDRITRNVRIGGYEEKEIRIALETPPAEVQVLPYFSRNRGKIARAVEIANRVRRGLPIDTVFTVVSAVDSLVFYTDDRDEGFFTAAAEETEYLRPPGRGKSWWDYTNPLGYGKYIFGWRYKRAGVGDYPAVWTAQVPRSGYYDLSFYLPVRNRWWANNISRRFKLTVTTADGPQPVELRFQETADGWVYLGRFRFDKDRLAVIELSDEGQGYILADAVRWEYVE